MLRTTLIAAALLAATPALACENIATQDFPIGACVDEQAWQGQPKQGDADFFYVSPDQTMAFIVIAESGSGTVQGLRGAILQNAAGGGDPSQVRVLGERIETVGGRPWNVIEYLAGTPGGEFTYQNFYYVDPDSGAVQFVFWSLPSDATSVAYKAGTLLSTLTMGAPDAAAPTAPSNAPAATPQ